MKKSYLIGLVCLLVHALSVANEENLNRLQGRTTILCTSEMAAGFTWRGNRWDPTNFAVGENYVVTKIPIGEYKNDSKRLEHPQWEMCKDPWVSDYSRNDLFAGVVYACYEIKTLGQKSSSIASLMCDEWWNDGKLTSINCKEHLQNFFLRPEGAFAKFPGTPDLNEKTDKKNPLLIETGRCNKLN